MRLHIINNINLIKKRNVQKKGAFMINQLKGFVSEVQESCIVLVVSGIGFGVFVSLPSSFSKNQEILLYTVLHWSQDNGPSLYGFSTSTEKALFELVTGCSGIGPKMGLAILRDLTPQEIVEAVDQEDSSILSKVSGIGVKKAEHMIVYLKHRIASKGIFLGDTVSGGVSLNWKEVGQALRSLGYSQAEIQGARAFVQKQNVDKPSFDELLRAALSFLSKKV
jgi:holliday junction DNA helicase RuvA